MNKITFGKLEIEVTRKCNMICSHCMRGDGQDTDIDLRYIDAVLDQADMIDSLTITGGEPTLPQAVDALEHIAEGLRERGVLLLQLQIFTNGFVYNKRFVDVIKEFRKIIDISCKYGFEQGTYNPAEEKSRIYIGVSLDKYHTDHNVCESNYQRYKKKLKDVADVLQIKHGNAVVRLGRAVNLEESVDQAHTYPIITRQRVEVLSKEHTPVCQVFDNFRMIAPDQKIICCGLLLCVDGSIKHGVCGSLSWDMIDNFPTICKATDPIWDAVISYGKGRISCAQSRHEQMEVGIANDFSRSEGMRLLEMQNNPENQDELSQAEEKQKWQWIIEAINEGNIYDQHIAAFLKARGEKEAVEDFLRDWRDIAKESSEYHHGSGKLPERKQPKPKAKIDVDRIIKQFTPDRAVRCWWCNKVIVNSEGKKIHCTEISLGKKKCQYCGHIN